MPTYTKESLLITMLAIGREELDAIWLQDFGFRAGPIEHDEIADAMRTAAKSIDPAEASEAGADALRSFVRRGLCELLGRPLPS